MGQPSPTVRVERDRGLARLVLDRPPVNVLNIRMLRELADAAASLADDPGVAVVLLTGTGKAFCAGVDVADHTADRVDEMLSTFHGALDRIASLAPPVVAAINGAALGGGCELALACDVVLARESAKLGQPEIQLGVFPPYAAAVLPRLTSPSRALDLMLTGRLVRAPEAERLGLVTRVLPDDDFEAAAETYARGMASLSAPVLRLCKRAARAGTDGRPLAEAVAEAERLYRDDLMSLEDPHEGLAAFIEKRAPTWKGR